MDEEIIEAVCNEIGIMEIAVTLVHLLVEDKKQTCHVMLGINLYHNSRI